MPGALAGRIKRADAPSGAPSVAGLPPYTQHSFFFFFHFIRQLFFSLDSFDYYPPKRNHLKSPSSANRCVSSKSDCGSSFRLFCFFPANVSSGKSNFVYFLLAALGCNLTGFFHYIKTTRAISEFELGEPSAEGESIRSVGFY